MDFISSFFQNVKDKLSNPFFGTLIFILIFHHWEFWYALLNFDDGVNLRQKLNYLKKLSYQEYSFSDIAIDIFFAGLFTVVGYGIIVATRSLSLWIEFNLMTKITKRVIEKKIVQRTEHEEVVKERDEYSEKYEEQRKNVRQLSKDYDQQTIQIAEKDKVQLELNETVSEIQKQLNVSAKKLERETKEHQDKSAQLTAALNNFKIQETEINDLKVKLTLQEVDLHDFKKLFFTDDPGDKLLYSNPFNFPSVIVNKVEEIKKNRLWSAFLAVGNYFHAGGSVNQEIFNKLGEIGVITHGPRGTERFTTVGNIIYQYRNTFSDHPKVSIR